MRTHDDQWYAQEARAIAIDLADRQPMRARTVVTEIRAPEPSAPRLQVQHAEDIIRTPRPVEIVEGIAWAGCLTVLASESGAGKTFVLLDLEAAVSAGLPWHGRATRCVSCVHLAYEGDALSVRLRALRDVGGHALEHLYVVRATDPLSPIVTRDGEMRSIGELDVTAALTALAADLAHRARPPIGLVVVDTARASMTGSEDSSEHVSQYLRAARRVLARLPDAAFILAHHTGWQDGDAPRKRERGSSAWRGNCDATLYLEAGAYDAERGETPLTLRTLKVRDAERPGPLHLVRRRVELAEAISDDLRRGAVTSCVIDADPRTREDLAAAEREAAASASRATELRVLRVIATQPALATSQDRIRVAVGLGRDVVVAAVAALLQRGWIVAPERQRQPYQVTPEGHTALTPEVQS